MRVFVSYSRRDGKLTDEVCRELEDQGHEIWRDTTSIPGGAGWRASIEKGIVDADVFVMLLSPHVLDSPEHARDELECARDFAKEIVPVYLAPVERLPEGFRLALSGRQHIELFPSFSAGMARLAEQLGQPAALPEPSERRRLEVKGWASDNVARLKAGAVKLRREAKQRDLGKKALKVGGLLAAGAAAAAAAAARQRAAGEAEARAQKTADYAQAMRRYREKVNDAIATCSRELGRLVVDDNPTQAYEREFRPLLQRALGQLEATEPPAVKVAEHRELVASLADTLDRLDGAFVELQKGDDAGARRELERMAERFVKTLEKYGEILSDED